MDTKYIMLHQNVLYCEAGDDLEHCHFCFYCSLVITVPLSVCKRPSVCLCVCRTGWLGEWRELFFIYPFFSWARENVRRRPSSFSLEGMFYFVNTLPSLSFLPPLTFLSVFFLAHFSSPLPLIVFVRIGFLLHCFIFFLHTLPYFLVFFFSFIFISLLLLTFLLFTSSCFTRVLYVHNSNTCSFCVSFFFSRFVLRSIFFCLISFIFS